MRVGEHWAAAGDMLRQRGVVDSEIEAEVLLRHALDIDRAGFFAALDIDLAPDRVELLDRLLNRRAEGEPLAYITGHREFYGLDLCVDHRVLIPRQETELLVDEVLEFAKGRRSKPLLVADVGTGSGAIAIALAHNLPNATVFATDSSREALLVADLNRRRHSVADRVRLLHGDLLRPLPGPVDVIVSNPPYLTSGELAGLTPEIRREPSRALDGGPEGLDVIIRLLLQARARVRPGGMVAIEIAPQQLEKVMLAGREAFPGVQISYARDILGLPRAVEIVLPASGERERSGTTSPFASVEMRR